MNKDEMQKQILEALTSGKIQATQIIVGDNVAKKIEVHEGGIGEQTNNYYYGQRITNNHPHLLLLSTKWLLPSKPCSIPTFANRRTGLL